MKNFKVKTSFVSHMGGYQFMIFILIFEENFLKYVAIIQDFSVWLRIGFEAILEKYFNNSRIDL